MNVLVVGASGYIGSALSKRLLAEGHEVVAVGGPFTGAKQTGFAYTEGLYTALQQELSSVDAVVYAAGRVVPTTTVTLTEALMLDVRPLTELLEALTRCHRQQAFVLLSSAGAIYGPAAAGETITESHPLRPVSTYGLVRALMEQAVAFSSRTGSIRATSLRLSNVYGPQQRLNGPAAFVARAVHACQSGKPMELWGDGSQRKDFLYIDDVTGATVSALARQRETTLPDALNVCTGSSSTLREVLTTIERVAGRPVPFVSKPVSHADVPRVDLSASAAKAALGWEAGVSLEVGLRYCLGM